jgi:6-hydroxynicotinate 3-monooxygenase
MPEQTPRIAIIGAGIGGLTAAACLRRIGIDVRIYEQARGFTRLGAGIQQAPNAVRVLYALGLEAQLLARAFQPESNDSRDYDTGELTNSLPLGRSILERHDVPYFLMHRGDLHAMLADIVPAEVVHLSHRLVGLDHGPTGTVRMQFTNGEAAEADAVIGADGVHSVVREIMLGREQPRYTGRVAYRTVIPTGRLNGAPVEPCVKWWGPDRHIVSYFVNPRRDELYFVTSTPEPEPSVESWSAKGDLATLRAAYDTFHPQVRAILAACPDVHKWALVERDPLPRWVEGNVALLGDACHSMTPYMAQGAATSIEDAAVLSRCLDGVGRDGLPAALRRYEATRRPRTSRIQQTSALNTWLREPHDADWVYGYDAWTVPLAD